MALAHVHLRVESDEDHVFNVPGVHQFKMKNQGSIIDLLVAAQNQNHEYNFSSRHIPKFGEVVTSLCGLFNDNEANKGWFFYTPPNSIVEIALSKVELTSGMEVVARYEEFTREEQKTQIYKTEVPKRKK